MSEGYPPYPYERWIGSTQQRLDEHERKLENVNRSLERTAEALEGLRITMARFLVLGPVLLVAANALVALAVYELTRGLG